MASFTPNQIKQPFIPAPPPSVPPRAYVLFKHTQKCACGCLHEFSELYSEHKLPSSWNKSHVRNLRPSPRIEYALPIEVITKPMVDLPFCHECVMGTTLSHLPPPPQEDVRVLASYQTALGEGIAAAAAKRSPKAPAATIDDIFNIIGK